MWVSRREIFEPKDSKYHVDWKAFSLWMEEAQTRDGRSGQAETGNVSSASQCVKIREVNLDVVLLK